MFRIYEEPNPDEIQEIPSKKYIYKQQITKTIMNIISLIMSNCTLILFLNEINDSNEYIPYNQDGKNLHFINALYYQMVTMLTIGFGDVTPSSISGRLLTTAYILLCAVLFNNWLSDLFNILSQDEHKIYDDIKDKSNSLVIIGNALQKDLQSELFLDNFYDFRNFEKDIKFKRGLIFYCSDEPFDISDNPEYTNQKAGFGAKIQSQTKNVQAFIKYETLKIQYEIKKINVVVNMNMDKDISWLNKVNFDNSAGIIVVNYSEYYNHAIEIERNYYFVIKLLRQKYPKTHIYAFFTTDILCEKCEDLKIRHNSQQNLTNSLLAKSVENPGVSTFVNHLLCNPSKITKNSEKYFKWIKNYQNIDAEQKEDFMDYYGSTFNHLYIETFFESAEGYEFSMISQMFYFQNQSEINNFKKQDRRIVIIGVKNYLTKKILTNPENYIVQKGDKCVFIANSLETVQNFKKTTLQQFEKYKEYLMQITQQSPISKNNISLQTLFKINQNSKNCYDNNQNPFVLKPIKVNLYENIKKLSLELPSDNLNDHIIIVGCNAHDRQKLVKQLRVYSKTRIIIFFESKWTNDVLEDNNTIIAVGNLDNAQHYELLQIQKCYKIVVVFHENYQFIHNSQLFKFYRNITKNVNIQKECIFLCLYDENYLQFFEQRIFNTDINLHFYPYALGSRTYFQNSIYHALNTQIYYNRSCATTLQQIIGIDQKNTNQQLFSLKLDYETCQNCKNYGQIIQYLYQYQLLPVGLVKSRQQSDDYANYNAYKRSPAHATQYESEFQEKLELVDYKGDFIIANPQLSKKIKEGDYIIVIGDVKQFFEQKIDKLQQQINEDNVKFDFVCSLKSSKLLQSQISITDQIIKFLQHEQNIQDNLMNWKIKAPCNRNSIIMQNSFSIKESKDESLDGYSSDIIQEYGSQNESSSDSDQI